MAIISISDSYVNSADQILVADASGKIPAKDGSQITVLNATNISSGTVATARLDTGTTAGKLVVLDGSGNLPAVDASLLTGIVSATISASDPTISTNPSGGVGTEWNNSTSGAMFICTDATAGENVWKNVGAGSGDVLPYTFQGTQYGYTHGGEGPNTSTDRNEIDKWPFASDANATDVGNLTTGTDYPSGASSTTHGYMGGARGSPRIEKYSFTTDGNATSVGTLAIANANSASGVSSADNGYHNGGWDYTAVAVSNVKQKYSFTTDGNSTDAGDLSVTRLQTGGHTDTVYGYTTCGAYTSTNYNVIDRYPFASDGNSVDVGDMTVAHHRMGGSSSLTHGYCTGGGGLDVIDKFAFGSSATGSDVGNLPSGDGWGLSGHSSTTHGYATSVGGLYSNQICKYSFTTDGNSTDVGDLTVARVYIAGTHV